MCECNQTINFRCFRCLTCACKEHLNWFHLIMLNLQTWTVHNIKIQSPRLIPGLGTYNQTIRQHSDLILLYDLVAVACTIKTIELSAIVNTEWYDRMKSQSTDSVWVKCGLLWIQWIDWSSLCESSTTMCHKILKRVELLMESRQSLMDFIIQ